ncbi:hypothetical protein QBC38DRAFT_222457 [Podospora fimiseda]|uniref:SNTX MACPF/CDC-like domain-containing protein n=1 Tax=Podospora fimiseda TaxID=252190 RepID=A0AAN7BNM3_9PEZI|nr:hypothetical protein QBC38DRAFT_222457 [Podospora fimiseda]
MSTPGFQQRPSLGQSVKLGRLYNAITDTFLAESLFNDNNPPPGAVDQRPFTSTRFNLGSSTTVAERCSLLGISPELGTSATIGLTKIEGSSCYLTSQDDTNLALHCTTTTFEEELNFTSPDIKASLATTSIEPGTATHVVGGIRYGTEWVFACNNSQKVTSPSGTSQSPESFLRHVKEALVSGKNPNNFPSSHSPSQDNSSLSANFVIFSNLLRQNPWSGSVTMHDLWHLVQQGEKSVGQDDNKSGTTYVFPTLYILVPLSMLSFFRLLEMKGDFTICQPSLECLQQSLALLSEAAAASKSVDSYLQRSRSHIAADPAHVRQIEHKIRQYNKSTETFKKNLALILSGNRSGSHDNDSLSKLCQAFQL